MRLDVGLPTEIVTTGSDSNVGVTHISIPCRVHIDPVVPR